MLEVVEKAFPELMNSQKGEEKLKKIVPFYKAEITKELFEVELEKSHISLDL